MAHVNKYIVIGRLTRDPTVTRFQTAACTSFGLATVGKHKKDAASGRLQEDPLFLECRAWSREKQGPGEVILQNLRKGHEAYFEGRLLMERWQKDGEERTRILFEVENVQIMSRPRAETQPVRGGLPGARPSQRPSQDHQDAQTYSGGYTPPPPPEERQEAPGAGNGHPEEAYPDEPGYNRRPVPSEDERRREVLGDDYPF